MIENSIQLGDPVEHRGIVIAPLFPRNDPRAEYLTLEEALPLGFRITEIDAAGSVPELLAFNPLETPVLLYDGEELLGAKQNRILNVTALGRDVAQARAAAYAAIGKISFPGMRYRTDIAERAEAHVG